MKYSTSLFFALALLGLGQGALAAPSSCRHRHHNKHKTNAGAVESGTETSPVVSNSTEVANTTAVPSDGAGLNLGAVPTSTEVGSGDSAVPVPTSAGTESAAPVGDDSGTTPVDSAPTSAAAPAATSAAADAGSGSGSSDSSDIKSMVQLHNDFRAQYGAGAVTWSDELASYAASHATVCKMEHTGGPYGENLAAGYGGGYSIADGFQAWADEAPEYNPSNPQYSHFTQVVWKGTTEIGCAAVKCPGGTVFSSGSESLYIMCEYNPPGNYVGKFAENVGSKSS